MATAHASRRILDAPTETIDAFAAALAAADLPSAAACFSREASLLTPDATIVQGREGIRSLLSQLIAAETRIEVEGGWLFCGGDIAVGSQRWSIWRPDRGSGAYARHTLAGVCLRRIEGVWKIAIAAPWGWPQLSER